MKYRLRSYDQAPPGGYPYTQTKGIRREFPSVPMIEHQAQIVASFRKANGLPRASVQEALSDIDCQQCLRLGNMPAFCVPSDSANIVALNQSSPIVAPPCKGCGAPVT